MLTTAIVLFLVTALLGLALLIAVLQDKVIPFKALLLHGLFAAIALLLVVFYLFKAGSSPLVIVGLGLLLLAALLGLIVANLNIDNKIVAKLLAVVHPLFAVIGLILLIIDVLP